MTVGVTCPARLGVLVYSVVAPLQIYLNSLYYATISRCFQPPVERPIMRAALLLAAATLGIIRVSEGA